MPLSEEGHHLDSHVAALHYTLACPPHPWVSGGLSSTRWLLGRDPHSQDSIRHVCPQPAGSWPDTQPSRTPALWSFLPSASVP